MNTPYYQGIRRTLGETIVTKEPHGVALPPCFDIHNHSPTGFEWGYGGSGPAQLSLAITFDVLGGNDPQLTEGEREAITERTRHVYQKVKAVWTRYIAVDEWVVTRSALVAIIAQLERERDERDRQRKGSAP
jgi:hypothetical protein